MKKTSALVSVRVLGSGLNDKAEKGDPKFFVMFEALNEKAIPGTDEKYEERVVERFKSLVDVPKGMQTLRVELGAYVNGTQAALYGRVLEVLPSNAAFNATKKA